MRVLSKQATRDPRAETVQSSPQTRGRMRTIVDLHTLQVHKRRETCALLGTYTPPKSTNSRNFTRT